MYFIKAIILMCHITNWATVWSSPKQSAESGFTLDFPTSEETIPVELQRFQKVKDWLDLVKHNQLPQNFCGGKEEESITTEDHLMRNGPCHETGAIKNYFFNGDLFHGKLNGTGVYWMGPNAPEQEKCIVFYQSPMNFSEPPDIVEGQFDDGVLYGTANLTWSHLGYKISAHISHGMVHGLFKVEKTNSLQWMIGSAERNSLSTNKPCWIMDDYDKIFHSECIGLFQLKKTAETPVTIFLHNMKILMTGYFSSKSPNVILAKDAKLEEVYNNQCSLKLRLHGILHEFEFDIVTNERDYKLNKTNLCNDTKSSADVKHEEITQIFEAYFSNIQPLAQDTTLVNKEKAVSLLSDIKFISPYNESNINLYEAQFHLYQNLQLTFLYNGLLDDQDQFHGYAILRILPEQYCFKGRCQFVPYESLRGYFNHGVLNGLVFITSKDDKVVTFTTVKNGIVHGMVMTLGLANHYPLEKATLNSHLHNNHFKSKTELAILSGVGRVGKFVNGKLSTNDKVWQGLFSAPKSTQGYLYGQIQTNDGQVGGINEAYVYPGARLALVGRFKNNHMESAQASKITRITCSNNVLKLEFSQPYGPKLHFNPSTNETIGEMPLVPDPYEEITVKVDTSGVPNSGNGLYAVRNIKKGEVFSFYNGLRYTDKEKTLQFDNCIKDREVTGETMEIRSMKCVKNRITGYKGELLDVPTYWDDLNVYNASLTHKINNKFRPFINAEFGLMDHPRFGSIVTAVATKDVNVGTELFLDYGYNVNSTHIKDVAPWYVEQYKATVEYIWKEQIGEDVSVLPIP